MIKKSLYPKTKRISRISEVVITEKLDGSNVGFFNFDNKLYIATRNNIIMLSEIEQCKDILYKGMYGWLIEHGCDLLNSLNDKSCIFGEWLGMGKIKYNTLDKKVYLFAKANVDNNFDVYNVYYDLELLKYPFKNQIIPSYIDIVPFVASFQSLPLIEFLDDIYKNYSEGVNRNVEGFIINNNNNILKYVRMKNGNLQEHKE